MQPNPVYCVLLVMASIGLLTTFFFTLRFMLTAERCPRCNSLRVHPFGTYRRCRHCQTVWNAHRPAPPTFRII